MTQHITFSGLHSANVTGYMTQDIKFSRLHLANGTGYCKHDTTHNIFWAALCKCQEFERVNHKEEIFMSLFLKHVEAKY